MLWSESAPGEIEGLPVDILGFRFLANMIQENAQVSHARKRLRGIGPEKLFGDIPTLPVHRFGLRKFSLLLIDSP
jgi:hypothetical protein